MNKERNWVDCVLSESGMNPSPCLEAYHHVRFIKPKRLNSLGVWTSSMAWRWKYIDLGYVETNRFALDLRLDTTSLRTRYYGLSIFMFSKKAGSSHNMTFKLWPGILHDPFLHHGSRKHCILFCHCGDIAIVQSCTHRVIRLIEVKLSELLVENLYVSWLNSLVVAIANTACAHLTLIWSLSRSNLQASAHWDTLEKSAWIELSFLWHHLANRTIAIFHI